METILLAFYGLVVIGFILFVLVVEKYKRQAVTEQERANHLDDVLSSSPLGFYCEIISDGKIRPLCSRQLCLMLNLVDPSSDFTSVLGMLSSGSQKDLEQAWKTLHKNGLPFELVVQNTLNLMHFKVHGSLLDTPYSGQSAYILWFENISYTTAQFTENALKYKQLSDEKEILEQALNTLPFPLSVEKDTHQLVFKNTVLENEPDETADLHWQEFHFEAIAGGKYVLRYGQDKTTEEGLNALLADAERAQKMVLKELPCPACLFDANTRLVFYNKAFADLWKLEPGWLKKEPFYEDFLNKLQEKGYLPQVKDFAQYKKVQKDLFSRLTKPFEDFIYLQNAQIIRRLMIPHAQGGILFIDECKTPEN